MNEDGLKPTQPLPSRLPRRVSVYPSVADLVKKYQHYLPPQGVEELTRTALAPAVPVSESEQESSPAVRRIRHKNRQPPFLSKRSSVSDFESSYAANIAPKYLTKRAAGQANLGSRIPVVNYPDSRSASRRTSPDKRPSFARTHTDTPLRPGRSSPPPPGRSITPAGASGSKTRSKPAMRFGPKDKAPQPRPASVANSKSTFRRPPTAGSKVSNIVKHFERINRENERASRRYAIIRGKRARPVASARAKVEVLESIKDAIKDESESSDSSEADDEGGGDDDDRPDQKSPRKSPQKYPELPGPAPELEVVFEPPPPPAEQPVAPRLDDNNVPEQTPEDAQPSVSHEIEAPPSAIGSPVLSPVSAGGMASVTPPPSDLDTYPHGRSSLLKAISGLWQQPQSLHRNRSDTDVDDPMADPEHIFRDSSMVVRTDEPTSIVALALK